MSGLGTEGLNIPKTIKLYINGAFARTESGRSFAVYHHNTENLYANLCWASRKDLRNSIEAAQSAFKGWSSKTSYNRSQILYRMAEMAEGKRLEFAQVLKTTLGYDEAQADTAINEAIDAFVYYAGFADKYQQVAGCINPVSGPHHNFTTVEPVGIVGLICDEKFNLGQIVAQIAAVICSGNSLVTLLPEQGSGVLAPLSEVFATSDLPVGVVNLLTGYPEELSATFGSHMELNTVSYQGQNAEMLAQLKQMAAENMKRVVTKSKDSQTLDNVLNYVEYKTVWHPVGS